jgi:hypothetical protein
MRVMFAYPVDEVAEPYEGAPEAEIPRQGALVIEDFAAVFVAQDQLGAGMHSRTVETLRQELGGDQQFRW